MQEHPEIKEIHDKKPRAKHYRDMRAKLIFNPSAGAARGSPIGILDVIHEMQAWKLVPEAFLVEAGCDLPGAVRDALARGYPDVRGLRWRRHHFVPWPESWPVHAPPWGSFPSARKTTRPSAWASRRTSRPPSHILRTGRRIKVDIGMATQPSSSSEGGELHTPFLELCSVGLVSTLFPSTDDVQHGNLARAGDFLATLVSSPPAEITLVLDGKQEVHALGHVVLVTNMPYIGRHYMVGSAASFHDGLLDVLFFADLSKLDLVGYMLHGVGTGNLEDPRIQHFHVRRVDIDTQPAMPIMADGSALGEGRVRIEVRRRVLAVMVGKSTPEATARRSGESLRRRMRRVSHNRPLIWLVALTTSLVLFLAWLPPYARLYFWHGLQAQALLASMTFGFGLLALSLLWSAGQRMDAWTFLFFNVRGRHPPWLDMLMQGCTQIGNGMAGVALALIFFSPGIICWLTSSSWAR